MKKFIMLPVLLLAGIIAVNAETDPKALPIVQDIQQGRNNANQIEVLRVKGAATIGGALTVSGAVGTGALAPASVAATGAISAGTDLTVADNLKVTPASQNVTNGQLLVALESANLIYGVGQAAALTNTITLAEPGAGMVGKYAMIAIGSTSSNVVKIADTAPADMSADFLMGVGDTLTLWASSATTWLEVARSNN